VEAEIIATARGAGMRIVGPNTQGLADFLSGVVNISSMFL
jgi:acyl-CoA synthetase (NDP forming)